jgi:biopolymer transport protein ExbD
MSAPRGKKRSWGQVVAAELNVMPLMNLFVVLIPLLLLSAVFIEVSVIDMNQSTSDEPQEKPEQEPLGLAIHIADAGYVVRGNGIESQTVVRSSNGEVTRNRLTKALREIVATHPENQNVQIVAQETTRYEEIITVMDISRSAGLPQAALTGAPNGAL